MSKNEAIVEALEEICQELKEIRIALIGLRQVMRAATGQI